MIYDKDTIEVPIDERTFTILKQIANSIDGDIEMEIDYPSGNSLCIATMSGCSGVDGEQQMFIHVL